ncbi:protein of unknown function [Taphrina deformans PYCC 5710]|uniref:Oxidoreductase, short chain dehydrogenase/reductase family n=1 Tax=Taphrina deformans (strain PYCC 5710 / ATCC 11124 / CBS 356.35 / IMI 108563 / JCM 9778 / NBRC 8474) TaxID=1097556 RepID=R4XCV4_TAPDE|nr:protein of unknown function [Taphrina deformans PYCC 5710]|eukprot:CCG83700.1 protein of unknown function [Taphrina deformans PYCC 5710]
MPVEFAAYVVQKTSWLYTISDAFNTLRTVYTGLAIGITYLLYIFFQGSKNKYEADMHGKVILMTGGTAGIGAAVASDLAGRGAQLILLVRSVSDGWTQDYVTQLREESNNELIYAEECDLEDLSSVRKFATKWIDNTPARRLDQVILCAGVAQPMYAPRRTTGDGVEIHFGLNYLANYSLLNILSPALRAQPSERDVRVIVATCTTYILGALDMSDPEFIRRGYPSSKPWQAFGASKIALMCMVKQLQHSIDQFQRPDKLPSRVKCLLVDPGLARTQSFRRFVSFGTLLGLFLYLLTYPVWFVLVKTAHGAAQSVLFASMAPSADIDEGGVRGGEIYQECMVKQPRRSEIADEGFRKKLWETSGKLVKEVEVRSALARKAADRQT